MSARALFLDRDGTLVQSRHYPSRPDDLVLYDGLAPHLVFLQHAGFRLVVVTNQAGIARGYFTESDLALMHEYLRNELERLSVRVDAFYHCPHHVDGIVPELAIACRCRKPQPGMLLAASSDHDIDLARSWFVGDILDDMEAGKRAGCRTVLVDLGTESPPVQSARRPDFIGRDTVHALEIIRAEEGLGPPVELSYLPTDWREEVCVP